MYDIRPGNGADLALDLLRADSEVILITSMSARGKSNVSYTIETQVCRKQKEHWMFRYAAFRAYLSSQGKKSDRPLYTTGTW